MRSSARLSPPSVGRRRAGVLGVRRHHRRIYTTCSRGSEGSGSTGFLRAWTPGTAGHLAIDHGRRSAVLSHWAISRRSPRVLLLVRVGARAAQWYKFFMLRVPVASSGHRLSARVVPVASSSCRGSREEGAGASGATAPLANPTTPRPVPAAVTRSLAAVGFQLAAAIMSTELSEHRVGPHDHASRGDRPRLRDECGGGIWRVLRRRRVLPASPARSSPPRGLRLGLFAKRLPALAIGLNCTARRAPAPPSIARE